MELVDGAEGFLNRLAVQVASDEHQSRPPVLTAPMVQGRWRVKHVLDAMNCDWLVLADDVENPFDAEQAVAASRQQRFQPYDEGLPFDRALESQAKGADTVVVAVDIVGVVMVDLGVGFFVEPALDVGNFAFRVEEPAIEEVPRFGVAWMESDDGGSRIEDLEPVNDDCRRLLLGDVGLGQDDAVGDGGLLEGLRMIVELRRAVYGVHGGHDAVEPVAGDDDGVGHQRLDDGGGIGESCRLDDGPPEGRNIALGPHDVKFTQGVRQIAPHRAAEAAGIQLDDVFADLAHQQVVEADLAELVDKHGRLVHVRVGEQAIEQRRLSAAEEARQHRDRN